VLIAATTLVKAVMVSMSVGALGQVTTRCARCCGRVQLPCSPLKLKSVAPSASPSGTGAGISALTTSSCPKLKWQTSFLVLNFFTVPREGKSRAARSSARAVRGFDLGRSTKQRYIRKAVPHCVMGAQRLSCAKVGVVPGVGTDYEER
jgi:hypothetical protein